VRRCPETGHEELVVLAGYCNNVLAAMNPHRLDLTTWRWVKESGLVPNPGHGDALALPSPRQRAAAETVGDKWLLILGGSPTQVWDVMPLFSGTFVLQHTNWADYHSCLPGHWPLAWTGTWLRSKSH